MNNFLHPGAIVVAALMSFVVGCAQDVGDIDRTQPNALTKADFAPDKVWFMRQTVTDVPATVRGLFVGIATDMEKVRFEIQESHLVVYRAYESIPGYHQNAGDRTGGVTPYRPGTAEGRTDDYKEAPIATFPITTHFDIERAYNSSTGEQSNIIVENTSDRPWHERKYFRVAWAAGQSDLSFPEFTQFYVQENEGTQEAWYEEREGEDLNYFDVTNKLAFNGAGHIDIVTSFSRLEEPERDYEPAFYDDQMMTKFGYFRTERFPYQRDVGFTDSGRIYLANRHDLWKNDYRRDESGEYLRDKDGRRLPTPMAKREPKPIVYYLSPNYPEALIPGAEHVAADFDRTFTRSVAAAKGMEPAEVTEQFGPMFVLCSNPVAEEDPAACDPRSEALKEAQEHAPYVARPGDVRKSFIFWVDQPQASGPLGYGPSYPDPETGELVSGTAYVYGAGVDRVAGSGVDIVRLVNGDYTEEQVRNGDDIAARILETRRHELDPRGRVSGAEFEKLPNVGLDELGSMLDPAKLAKLEQVTQGGLEPLEARIGHREAVFQKLKDAGLDRLLLDDEYVRAMSGGDLLQLSETTPEQLEQMLEEANPFDLEYHARAERERHDLFARHNVYLEEFADEAVIGTALEFKGETDYDAIWNELRNRVFAGVMAHEVGHTLGLRHNFQGSWDSLNYFDQYWELRKENFEFPETIPDLYRINSLTEKQIEGDMTRYEYSSIMDYHARFNSDTSGIGKYDEAAIIFAYTFGTYDEVDADNEDPIVAQPGFVEVFMDVPDTGDFQGQEVDTKGLLHSYDFRYAASQHPLEDFHYTTLIEFMGGPENLQRRELVSYAKLREQQLDEDDSRPIEVPYMFCSDEWAGAAISCDRWDLGADPFEKVQWAIKSYEDYYPLTHFRRNRLQFSVSSVLNRAYRAFGTMPSVYQRWFFDQYYSSDQTLSNYFTLAAFAGFNFLMEQNSTPSYGAYQWDPDSQFYELVSYDPEYSDADLRVDYGEGKRLYSTYARDGYYFFSRITSVGNYWERYVATQMLSAVTNTFVLGADTQADFRSYLIPYYLVFDDELTGAFNGLYLNDYRSVSPFQGDVGVRQPTFAPLYTDGVAFNPLTGAALPETGSQRQIRTSINFTQRVNAMIYGVAFFSSAYSPGYIDQARVWRLGSGDGLMTREMLCRQQGLGDTCATDTHELVAFTHLNSGVTYAAMKDKSATTQTLAVRLIEDGKYAEDIAVDPATSSQTVTAARNYQDNVTEDIVMLLETVDALGSIIF